METVNTRPVQHQSAWLRELAQLLARPVDTKQGVSRQGSRLGVHITPLPRADQQTLDLTVGVFFTYLSPPQLEEQQADAVALQVFLRGLHHTDLQLRIAACEALGRLGNALAKEALQQAAREDNPYVRRAATQALNSIDLPRAPREELAGIRLTLWRQVRHLWQPVGTATTDQQGRARFTNIPAGSRCRLQAMARERQPAGIFSAPLLSNHQSGELAAEDMAANAQTLPHSHWLTLPDGNLLLTLYRNDREEIVAEFRSDAPQLQGGWVHVSMTNKNTKEQILSRFVALHSEDQGVFTAQLVLSSLFDLQNEYEIEFFPISAPPDSD